MNFENVTKSCFCRFIKLALLLISTHPLYWRQRVMINKIFVSWKDLLLPHKVQFWFHCSSMHTLVPYLLFLSIIPHKLLLITNKNLAIILGNKHFNLDTKICQLVVSSHDEELLKKKTGNGWIRGTNDIKLLELPLIKNQKLKKGWLTKRLCQCLLQVKLTCYNHVLWSLQHLKKIILNNIRQMIL